MRHGLPWFDAGAGPRRTYPIASGETHATQSEARRRNIRFIAYQTRYLILPWVRVKFLASHILGRMAGRISQDWERIYGHGIYYLETFINPERSRGTCYQAANWMALGLTTGRG